MIKSKDDLKNKVIVVKNNKILKTLCAQMESLGFENSFHDTKFASDYSNRDCNTMVVHQDEFFFTPNKIGEKNIIACYKSGHTLIKINTIFTQKQLNLMKL